MAAGPQSHWGNAGDLLANEAGEGLQISDELLKVNHYYNYNKKLHDRESNPGLPLDKRGY